jgi:FeS assembly SUF system protein
MTYLDDSPAAAAEEQPALAGGATDGATDLVEAVIAALRTVHDPEIPVNIYDLGLIYRIAPDHQGAVEIDMTLTAPGCPVAGEMMNWVRKAVGDVAGVESVNVNLVFDPPWDKSKMSEDVQLELGLL